jgi:predicted O-linked N-acetylglucosamine transferase (SPINDLY family)
MTQLSVRQALDLAHSLARAGRLGEAGGIYRQVLQSDADQVEALHGLGLVLAVARRFEEAAERLGRALALDPTIRDANGYLGDCYRALGRPSEAVECYRRELAAHPDTGSTFLPQLAKALPEIGQTAEAIDCCRRALALAPDGAALHSQLLTALRFGSTADEAAIVAEHRAWAARHAAPLAREIRPHANDRTPDRRLRVGYVSPDFRHHSVAWSILPILEHHDRDRFEVFCYSDAADPDEITERVRASADVWRDTRAAAAGRDRSWRASDATLAEQIRLDRIDILVDLALHTEGNRLLAFARRPAPVQISYLGYNASTGLPAMDYRITDAHMDPPGEPTDGPEELLRLPNCYWAYRPVAPHVEVGPPPRAQNGFVTFGSFNSFIKITPAVVAAWARVLAAVPDARLLAVVPGGNHNTHARTLFESHGVAAGRLRLVPRLPVEPFFRLYHEVDLTLDPFPYNGGITSLDSLWMGVPFVTLAGGRAVSRAGLSILTNIGLSEYVARDVEQYVALHAQLARDADRLAALRGSLRQRLRQSPLTDERRFTRDLECLYVTAWERWRRSAGP